MKKRGAAGPTGGGPKSANIDGTPTARDARDDDSACCATPLAGTRIVYSRKVDNHSSGLSNMMACHLAVVAAHDDAAIAAAMDDDERRDEQRSIAAVGGSTEADWTKTSPDEETRAEIRELAKALGKILVGWNHTASGVPRTVIIVPDTPHVRGFCLSLC